MPYNLYQINAFTASSFGGNPACIVPLEYWLPDDVLLKITKENAVAETAFFVKDENKIHLRWFTPEIEMDLCGHATLATAHCLKTFFNYTNDNIVFKTASGELSVKSDGDVYHMNLPSRMPVSDVLPEVISQALNIQPIATLKSRDYVLVFNSEDEVQNIKINRPLFDTINLDPGGVIVTAVGNHCDFVSRYFTPQASILEDPVTGSAHCSLVPYWAKQLTKKTLYAQQISERKGTLYAQDKGDRIILSGKAKTYAMGKFWID